jgi:diguanylate cyclase (GGDEF)-like protein/PAS domain S-box-containing protein
MTTTMHQLESEVYRLTVENKRLKRILAFEANTLADELLEAEERLDQSGRDLHSILNNVPAMIGYWDKNLRNRFGNSAYMEWFGDSPTSMAGKHIREVLGEERYQLNLPYMEAALRGERQEFERAIPTPDGKQMRYSLAQYIPDIVDGAVHGFYAVVFDISATKSTETRLRLREEQLRGLFEVSPLGIAMADMSGHFVEFNESFRAMCGYTEEELKSLDYWKLTPEKYMASEALQIETIQRTGRFGPYEKEYIRKDGSLIPLSLSGVLTTDKDNQQFIWCIAEDITERKLAQEALRTSQQRLTLAMDSAQMGAWDLDLIDNSSWRSLRHDQIFGYDSEVLHWDQKIFLQHIAPEDRKRVALCFDEAMSTKFLTFECQIVWPDQSRHWIFAQGQVHSNEQGQAARISGIVQDITERKLAEQKIQNLAFFDPLTKLPNRQLLLDRLQHSLALNVRQRQYGALMLIDLDNFKTLNDTLGHRQGDLLLQQVALRLEACMRAGDTVARLGGDEFIVILENLSENALLAASQAAIVAEKILLQMGQNYDFGSWTHRCTSSIGITLFGDRLEEVDAVLMRADLAMYKAKDEGRNTFCFFDPEMQFEITNRVILEEDLRQALGEQQFSVHYQGQVDAASRIVGAEALLRWWHPTRGWVSPAEFIPKAEKTGLILPLGLWVLETACAQLALWASQPGMAELTLAVNVSARQFHDEDFVEQVLATLVRTGAKAHLLKLELTESLLVTKVEDVIGKMQALKTRGVQFALDDFGTGYSSLSYLKRLPLDQLKIDQSFVHNILTDPDDAAIARMVIALANSLELAVIAEGVETQAQRDLLAELGCHSYQGYLFSRPLPAKEFAAFIKAAFWKSVQPLCARDRL